MHNDAIINDRNTRRSLKSGPTRQEIINVQLMAITCKKAIIKVEQRQK